MRSAAAPEAAELGSRQAQFRQEPSQHRALQLQASAIDVNQFLDDIQSQDGALHLLVELDAAAQHLPRLFLAEAGAVILDLDEEGGAGLPALGDHRDADLAL